MVIGLNAAEDVQGVGPVQSVWMVHGLCTVDGDRLHGLEAVVPE